MINRVILMGRITNDLEVRQTQSGTAVLRFGVAVDRPSKQDTEKQTDFISCVAWGQRAEFINRYFSKGRMIAVEGSLKTGSYDDKNGVKHYTTDVWIDNVSFTGEKSDTDSRGSHQDNRNEGRQNDSYKSGQPSGAVKEPAPANTLGGLDDDLEVLSDGGVPF